MKLPIKVLPKAVPTQKYREPQGNIPPTKGEREDLLRRIRQYLDSQSLVPPIPLEELRKETASFCRAHDIDLAYLEYAAVLLNNEVWRDTLASVPYERRLLLLPKCLRVEDHCPAPFDEFGLLCKKCGMCSIQDLQDEAEKLGYAVLVAEGSPVVMAIIETGKIDAIVGVSCLNVLERAFPYMEAGAVPGVAIPLLQDDCKDTTVDLEWIWETIHLTSEDRTRRMDLVGLREAVDSWFSPESLEGILGSASTDTERIGHQWLARAGKRWRPFLTVAVHQALQDDPTGVVVDALRKVAVAVECFHKASLVHDDIEDHDEERYGERTLHEEHGMPVALNVGDYLLGEGYRLLAECDASPEVRSQMLRVAACGHRKLCIGQGAELSWSRNPMPLRSLEVLEIHRQKTSPAFEVALRLGAIFAGKEEPIRDVIERFSRSLGLAYQIRDDLDDLVGRSEPDDISAGRPTLPLAVGLERAKGEDKEVLNLLWQGQTVGDFEFSSFVQRLESMGVLERCRALSEAYKEEAIRALWDLDNANLKGLLRRVIGKIFNDTQIKGWCNEFETRNAASREVGAPAAG